MNAAIYARVSTTDQRNELQIRELTEYIERRGWMLAGIYQDQMSGAKAQRPGLTALIADARLHKFDAVVVWKLDRFGRSLVNCVGGIQELTAAGVRFIAVSQGLDTDTSNPTSRLLLHVLAAVAEFERELIKERVAAGLKNAKAKGTRVGRPRVVFDRQRALDMRQQGMSYPAIARALKIGYGTVVREIANLSKTRAQTHEQLQEPAVVEAAS
jgi:DNA invertase Pin-like site-specific DNA recombinase